MKKLIKWLINLLYGGSLDYLLKKYYGKIKLASPEHEIPENAVTVREAVKILNRLKNLSNWSNVKTSFHDMVPGATHALEIGWAGFGKKLLQCVELTHNLMLDAGVMNYLTTTISSVLNEKVFSEYIYSVEVSPLHKSSNDDTFYTFNTGLRIIMNVEGTLYEFPIEVDANVDLNPSTLNNFNNNKVTLSVS